MIAPEGYVPFSKVFNDAVKKYQNKAIKELGAHYTEGNTQYFGFRYQDYLIDKILDHSKGRLCLSNGTEIIENIDWDLILTRFRSSVFFVTSKRNDTLSDFRLSREWRIEGKKVSTQDFLSMGYEKSSEWFRLSGFSNGLVLFQYPMFQLTFRLLKLLEEKSLTPYVNYLTSKNVSTLRPYDGYVLCVEGTDQGSFWNAKRRLFTDEPKKSDKRLAIEAKLSEWFPNGQKTKSYKEIRRDLESEGLTSYGNDVLREILKGIAEKH